MGNVTQLHLNSFFTGKAVHFSVVSHVCCRYSSTEFERLYICCYMLFDSKLQQKLSRREVTEPPLTLHTLLGQYHILEVLESTLSPKMSYPGLSS